MGKKLARRPKHIPHRTCAGCGLVLPKKAMIRLVKTDEGILVDPTGKMNGRGTYLHNNRNCWEKGLRGGVARALKIEMNDIDKQFLQSYLSTLVEDKSPEESNNQQWSPS